jgi:HEAT repeat protein
MTALSLALVLLLAGVGTPPRNARPTTGETPAEGSAAEGLSDEQVASQVEAYLGSIDTPVSAGRWRALGPRAVAPLAEVVHDANALPSRRAKAVEALSAVGGARSREIVLEVARSEEEPFGVRASALRGAGRMLGTKELVRELRPVMERAHEAPTRATAAEVLARHAPRSSCQAVRAQANREARAVRMYARALERCQAAAP